MVRDVKELFTYFCRRYGGRVEGSTCKLPLRNLYYALDEFGREVAREELYHFGAPLWFIGEEVEPRRHRIVNVEVIPRGDKVNVRVTLSRHVHDKLFKTFKEESGRAEGSYHIKLDNEFTLRAWDRVEASWSELGDKVGRLISDLSIETTKVAGVDDRAWRWFKKRVEESHDWWELTRGE